jgi:hypothetical protein
MPLIAKKTYKRKARPSKKAPKVVYPKHIYGAHKSWTVTDPAYTQVTNSTTRLGIIKPSDISPGDLFNNRNTNTVWLNNLQFLLNVRNTATTSRYIRVMAITLANGSTNADTTSFSDLLTQNNNINIVGPIGKSEDNLFRVNYSVYRPLYDKVIKIPGTANGEANSKNLKFNIPIKKMVSYEQNSNVPRRNPIYLLWFMSEGEGLATSGTPMYESYRVTTHFKELIK